MFGGSKELPKEGTIRPILFANRLKTDNGKITEIETIIAREKDFAFNAQGVLQTKDQDWDTILAPEKQHSEGIGGCCQQLFRPVCRRYNRKRPVRKDM
jgi:hypothetical protein